MAAIDDRANALYPISNDDYNEPIGYYTYADLKTDECNAYIKGATEQHKIDIDKACEYLRIHIFGHYPTREKIVNDFRKAMEEEP